MGNIAIVVDLPDIDELEQVYRLDASEIKPEGMPSEDVPAGMPSEDEPEGMPSELQNRASVAEPPGRLPSRSPGKPTRRGFFVMSHRTHKIAPVTGD